MCIYLFIYAVNSILVLRNSNAEIEKRRVKSIPLDLEWVKKAVRNPTAV